MKTTTMLVVLVMVLCGAASAGNVSWIAGESCLPDWSVRPNSPATYDSVHFSGPISFFSNSCLGEVAMGGTPNLTIDSVGKTIKLWFQGPAPSVCPLIYAPVCGLEGDFGPLQAGQWRFFCEHPLATFSITFTVRATGTGGGGGFPCPAYDSGWVPLPYGAQAIFRKTLTHGLGGNLDNYVVDFQVKRNTIAGVQYITNRSLGTDFYYDWLTTESITVVGPAGIPIDAGAWVRVCIWVYECEPAPPTPTGVCCYAPGDRVRLLVDDPRLATNLPAGTLGTVLCCDSDDPDLSILVSWDDWSGGYNRDSFCDVPPGSYPNDSAYWMACDQLGRASGEGYFDECGVLIRDVQGVVECMLFEADAGGRYLVGGHYGFEVGDRIRVRGLLIVPCMTLVCGVDGCIENTIISQCAE